MQNHWLFSSNNIYFCKWQKADENKKVKRTSKIWKNEIRLVAVRKQNVSQYKLITLNELRRIPLKVRATSAKIIYWKSNYITLTFWILFKTSHCTSFLQVTPRWNPQAFSRNLMSNLMRMLHVCVRVVLKAGMPESRKARMPECRNAGNQDPEILKPGMTFREGKRAK